MSDLLSHLSDEPGNNGNISVRWKTDSDMTVDHASIVAADHCETRDSAMHRVALPYRRYLSFSYHGGELWNRLLVYNARFFSRLFPSG